MLTTSKRRTDQAVAVIRNWIELGLMEPVDPLLLLFNTWAITQFFAEHTEQILYFTEQPELDATARERIIRAEHRSSCGARVSADRLCIARPRGQGAWVGHRRTGMRRVFHAGRPACGLKASQFGRWFDGRPFASARPLRDNYGADPAHRSTDEVGFAIRLAAENA